MDAMSPAVRTKRLFVRDRERNGVQEVERSNRSAPTTPLTHEVAPPADPEGLSFWGFYPGLPRQPDAVEPLGPRISPSRAAGGDFALTPIAPSRRAEPSHALGPAPYIREAPRRAPQNPRPGQCLPGYADKARVLSGEASLDTTLTSPLSRSASHSPLANGSGTRISYVSRGVDVPTLGRGPNCRRPGFGPATARSLASRGPWQIDSPSDRTTDLALEELKTPVHRGHDEASFSLTSGVGAYAGRFVRRRPGIERIDCGAPHQGCSVPFGTREGAPTWIERSSNGRSRVTRMRTPA